MQLSIRRPRATRTGVCVAALTLAAGAALFEVASARMPGVPAGATMISATEWRSLSSKGQLGPNVTFLSEHPAAPPASEERLELISESDGEVHEIHFLSDAELDADIAKFSSLFSSQANQQIIHRVLAPHAGAQAANAAEPGADGLRATNESLANDIANGKTSGTPSIWGKGPPAGSGCGTGVIGWGNGSDISGNKHHVTYSADGIHKHFQWPLKRFTPCVKDQAKRGTCTQFAVVGATEEVIAEKYGVWSDFSEQASAAQDKIFWKPSITGAESAQLLLDNSQNGYVIPFEKAWDYNGARKGTKATPPGVPAGATSAGQCIGYHEFCSNSSGEGKYVCAVLGGSRVTCAFATQVPNDHQGARILSYASLYDSASPSGSFDLARSFLAMGYPVVFEGDVADHFNVPGGYLKAPMLGPHKRDGHAYNIVGYISNKALHDKIPNAPPAGGGGYFIIRNSWGVSYGDRGYGYMPVVWATKYVNAILTVIDAQLLNS
jgi:hypothetical protein